MKLRLRTKALISTVGLLVLFFTISMWVQHRLVQTQAVATKEAALEAAFLRFLDAIDESTDAQAAKAAALAELGGWLYNVKRENPSLDAADAAMQLALSQLRTATDPATLGGGIWYEPFSVEPDRRWLGAYAVAEGPGRAKPDWEYSTDAYAYTTHHWYAIALPPSWDRSLPRVRDLYMTEPYLDSLDGRPTVFVTFTQVMYAPERARIVGVATADWTFDSLAVALRDFHLTESSFSFLVHEPSRKVLFPVSRDQLVTVSEMPWGADLDFSHARLGSIERVENVSLDGRRYHAIFTRTHAGFVFGHFIAVDEAYAFLDQLKRQNLLLAIMTLILAGAAVSFAVSRLIRPLHDLAESARIIAAGNLEHTASVQTSDEVGEVARAFNDAHRRVRDYAVALEQTADQLRVSEHHFRALIENATDIIAVVHADGRIDYASPSVQRSLGYTPQRLVGSSIGQLVSEEDFAEARRALDRLTAHSSPVESLEVSLRHANGSWLRFEAILTLLDGKVVLNARDVTARKQAEAALLRRDSQLREVAKLESLGRLAGGIAHDFNNAVTVVLVTAQLLMRERRSDLRLVASLRGVLTAGEHAAALTKKLLTFSRLSVAQSRAIELNDVVVSLENMLRRVIGEDIELTTVLAKEPLVIRADPSEIEQVLMNLAVNSRDAMPEGGGLTIRTYRERRLALAMSINGEVPPGEYVVLEVADTGVGMDAQTLSKAFDPFFSTKGLERGTGLGLSTVYGIVNDSGGRIFVDSAIGQGTRFHIYWTPASGPVQPRAVSNTTIGAERGTVLVAEDDEGVRKITVEVLSGAGFSVLQARDGQEALDVLAEHPSVDLLITDVVMPRMKGPQLAAAVEARRPGIPVLFVSGYVAGELGSEDVAEPRHGYLQKPFTPERLLEAATALLENARKTAAEERAE